MLNRLAIIFFTMFISNQAYALNVSAQVDRTTISVNESLRLVVAVDESANENIDFSQLESQFDIINQQRSQRQQIINGQRSALTQWILILAPKEAGNILIPSFRYKNVFSNPIEILINEANAQDGSINTDVFLEITADKNSAYVQEQILLKTRLYYKISLSSYEAPEFSLKDTTINLVSETTYKTSLNNERYQVLELIHALHAQTSGEIMIPQLRWRLEKPTRGFFDRSGTPFLFVKSNELSLEIKPIPPSITADHWLPSTAVTLVPQWKQSAQQANVGDPLNLTLTLTANGLTAAQLPEITLPKVDQLTIFKERSTTDDIKSGRGVIGSRTSQFTIIPKETGKVYLPEITLKWWNVNSNKEEQISIGAQELIVASSNLQQDILPEAPMLIEQTSSDTSSPVHTSFWWAMAFILLLFLLGLAYIFYRLNKSSTGSKEERRSLEKPSMRSINRSIQRCIDQNSVNELPLLLIQWGREFCGDDSINSTLQLGEKLPDLKEELEAMNAFLYGGSNAHWKASSMLARLKAIEKKPIDKTRQVLLKPLYQ